MTRTPPRILPLPREEWTDAARDEFAFWGEPNAWEEGSKSDLVMVMAQSKAMAFGPRDEILNKLRQSAKPAPAPAAAVGGLRVVPEPKGNA